jgi:hypothetical protein
MIYYLLKQNVGKLMKIIFFIMSENSSYVGNFQIFVDKWLLIDFFRYQEYRTEYISTQKRAYFNTHKDEEWYVSLYSLNIYSFQSLNIYDEITDCHILQVHTSWCYFPFLVLLFYIGWKINIIQQICSLSLKGNFIAVLQFYWKTEHIVLLLILMGLYFLSRVFLGGGGCLLDR